jgi:tripartite-type tricarboxylate transporter receptor subunit TctC
LRALGVMSDRRSPVLPELPAVGETVPGFDITSWAGVFVPAGTPAAIVDRLSAELVKAIAKPAVSQRLIEMGLEPAASGPAELTRFVAQQRARWGAKIKAAGIQPE